MSIFMYMIHSIKKRFKMHLNVLIILTCAFILPLIFSILRDSYIYGDKMQALNNVEKEYHAHYKIINSKEEYLDKFGHMMKFDAMYEGGNIYLYIKESNLAQKFIGGTLDDTTRFNELDFELVSILNEIQDPTLVVQELSGLYRTSHGTENFSFQITFMIGIVILISMLVVQAAYKIHVGNFSHEIGILTAIGATKKQIIKLFAMELLFLYLVSGSVAFFVTYFGMKTLFKFYLEVKESTFGWQIFNVDWLNTIVIYIIILVFLCALFVFIFYKFLLKTPVQLLASSENNEKIKRYKDTIKFGKSPITTYSKILLKRSNKSFIASIIISLPIVVVIIFAFNYANINASLITSKSEYDVRISKNKIHKDDTGYFEDEELKFLEHMDGVNKYLLLKNIPIGEFYVKPEFDAGGLISSVKINEEDYLKTGIRSIQEIPSDLYTENLNIKEGYVVLNKNHVLSSNYKIGDQIALYKNYGVNQNSLSHVHEDDEDDHSIDIDSSSQIGLSEPMYYTIGGFVDEEWAELFLPLYFNDKDYQLITEEYGYNTALLKSETNENYDDFITKLNNRFGDTFKYTLADLKLEYEIGEKGSTGIYILIEVILVVLSVFMVIILYVFLSEYIRGQSENIRYLYILGASKETIVKIYILQTFLVSLFTLVISSVLGIGLSSSFFMNTGYHISFGLMTIVTYVGVVLLIMMSFLLPVFIELKAKLKKI